MRAFEVGFLMRGLAGFVAGIALAVAYIAGLWGKRP